MVQSNAGVGFHNNDQGHTAYVVGRDGIVDVADHGDCPEENTLYQMMKALTHDLRGYPAFDKDELVNTWQDFCRIATDAYKAHS